MNTAFIFFVSVGTFRALVYIPGEGVKVGTFHVDGVRSEFEACTMLAKQKAGIFKVADMDQRAWANVLAQGVEVATY